MNDERRDHGRFEWRVICEDAGHRATRRRTLNHDARNRNQVATFGVTYGPGDRSFKFTEDVYIKETEEVQNRFIDSLADSLAIEISIKLGKDKRRANY